MASLKLPLLKASTVVFAAAVLATAFQATAVAAADDSNADRTPQFVRELRQAKIASVNSEGKKGPQSRIVGGYDTDITNVPWQVALLWESDGDEMASNFLDQMCGGSIINEDWIVTAAHCVSFMDPSELKVLAGVTELGKGKLGRRAVEEIIVHPNYDDQEYHDDIALVKLWNPLTFNSKVQPIGLATTRPAVGTAAQISGWGNTWFIDDGVTGGWPMNLQQAEVSIRDNAECATELGEFGDENFEPESMVCARDGGPDAETMSKGVCYGDSGGPLAVQSGAQWQLAGITSWGIHCAWTSAPVFTDVAYYSSWISENAIKKVPDVRYTHTKNRTGYKVTVTNAHPDNNYVVSKLSGPGSVTVGTRSGRTLPITVSGLKAGESATLKISVARTSYVGTSTVLRSHALKNAKIPRFSKVSATKKGAKFKITNYNPRYRFTVTKASGHGKVKVGKAKGAKLPVTVTGLKPGKKIKVRVRVTRSGFVTGVKTLTIKR